VVKDRIVPNGIVRTKLYGRVLEMLMVSKRHAPLSTSCGMIILSIAWEGWIFQSLVPSQPTNKLDCSASEQGIGLGPKTVWIGASFDD
jgi:hypothetical protein